MSTLENIPGIGPALRRGLDTLGIADAAALAKTDVATITQVRGISPARAETFIAAAKRLAAAADPAQAAREIETETAKPKSPDKTSKAADTSKGTKKKAAKPKTKEKKSGKDKSGKSGKARKAKPSKKKKGKTKKG
ncbi:helix-hairpin-helix domain-containing protein [Roseovarius sp. MBR-6]|jgi:Holliday junction resolvasome RuvABC DNA-binding subunit|uniref:helix-hairpin-helix domain-containing protein n=1 Tax=Roseovarius sp. MBR-6 TaxID=3156459 RepID=UPI00339371B0